LLARSALADEIGTDHHLDALVAFGLDRDQVDEPSRRMWAPGRRRGS
jgi:hypothetical protein